MDIIVRVIKTTFHLRINLIFSSLTFCSACWTAIHLAFEFDGAITTYFTYGFKKTAHELATAERLLCIQQATHSYSGCFMHPVCTCFSLVYSNTGKSCSLSSLSTPFFLLHSVLYKAILTLNVFKSMAKTHSWTQIIRTNSWQLNVCHCLSSSHWSPTYPSNCQIIGGLDPVDPDLVGQDPKQVVSFKNSSSNKHKPQGMSFKHNVLRRHAHPYLDGLIWYANKHKRIMIKRLVVDIQTLKVEVPEKYDSCIIYWFNKTK